MSKYIRLAMYLSASNWQNGIHIYCEVWWRFLKSFARRYNSLSYNINIHKPYILILFKNKWGIPQRLWLWKQIVIIFARVPKFGRVRDFSFLFKIFKFWRLNFEKFSNICQTTMMALWHFDLYLKEIWTPHQGHRWQLTTTKIFLPFKYVVSPMNRNKNTENT